jgi:hypothetical protein
VTRRRRTNFLWSRCKRGAALVSVYISAATPQIQLVPLSTEALVASSTRPSGAPNSNLKTWVANTISAGVKGVMVRRPPCAVGHDPLGGSISTSVVGTNSIYSGGAEDIVTRGINYLSVFDPPESLTRNQTRISQVSVASWSSSSSKINLFYVGGNIPVMVFIGHPVHRPLRASDSASMGFTAPVVVRHKLKLKNYSGGRRTSSRGITIRMWSSAHQLVIALCQRPCEGNDVLACDKLKVLVSG